MDRDIGPMLTLQNSMQDVCCNADGVSEIVARRQHADVRVSSSSFAEL